MTDWILQGDFGTGPGDIGAMLLAMMIAFLCGHVIAWVYMGCHSGLSYSRSFVVSLVVLCMIVALVMLVMANNLLIAFGLMAVFAVVRFRNILRDTLDTAYILASITCGMGAGTRKFSTAIVGCAIFAAVMLYLTWSGFGTRHRYDLILNLHWARPVSEFPELSAVLGRHSRNSQIASQRSAPGFEGIDFSFRLLLRDIGRVDELVAELKAFPGVSRVTSLRAEEESEV